MRGRAPRRGHAAPSRTRATCLCTREEDLGAKAPSPTPLRNRHRTGCCSCHRWSPAREAPRGKDRRRSPRARRAPAGRGRTRRGCRPCGPVAIVRTSAQCHPRPAWRPHGPLIRLPEKYAWSRGQLEAGSGRTTNDARRRLPWRPGPECRRHALRVFRSHACGAVRTRSGGGCGFNDPYPPTGCASTLKNPQKGMGR